METPAACLSAPEGCYPSGPCCTYIHGLITITRCAWELLWRCRRNVSWSKMLQLACWLESTGVLWECLSLFLACLNKRAGAISKAALREAHVATAYMPGIKSNSFTTEMCWYLWFARHACHFASARGGRSCRVEILLGGAPKNCTSSSGLNYCILGFHNCALQ